MKKILIYFVCFMMFFLGNTEAQASENAYDDPQYGRELEKQQESMYFVQTYGTETTGYTHNKRFEGYAVEDVIDVSRYQYSINWKKVKESGIDYAMIRVGFRGYGESGSLNVDTYFKENMREALQYGVEVGVYFFSQAITEKEAVEEANYVLDLIKGYDVTLPVVIDFEYASDGSGKVGRLYNANLSKSKATKICKAFCSTVLEQGYTPMVYANKQMLEQGLNASELAREYKIWLANYTTETTYQGAYEFWQYTQSGSVDGIYGGVDKNFWYREPETEYVIKEIAADIPETEAYRIAGKLRYDTAFKIAENLKKEMGVEKFENMIVASGKNFADALAGSYLAYVKNAPIIMTNGKNAQDVKDYIKNNLETGGTVYILGGTAAVPEGVGCGLSEFHVKRLSGATRYETNLEILKEAGVRDEEILVCTGKNFADSLSGSAAKRPILLVTTKLSEKQKQYLSTLSGNEFYIIGGTGAVSTAVENEVKRYGSTQRLSGATRIETSVMIAETFFDAPTAAILAYSNNFPDGLCGGPLAMSMDAPLLLTRTGKEEAVQAYAAANGIHSGAVLGGNILIDDLTVANIFGNIEI